MPIIVTMGGPLWGQETKGRFAAEACKLIDAKTVVRYGGCNGSHYVLSNGLSHAFSHYGSGSFFPDVNTILAGMVIDPFLLFDEAEELEQLGLAENMFARIQIHHRCLSITPFHGAISRFREKVRDLTGTKKGTVGMGVGEAISDSKSYPDLAIRAGDFSNLALLTKRIEKVRQQKLKQAEALIREFDLEDIGTAWEEMELLRSSSVVEATARTMQNLTEWVRIINDNEFKQAILAAGNIVVEGSHGILLHPYYGFAPHVSQVDPTGATLIKILRQTCKVGKGYRFVRILALRPFAHRHGNGPLVTQDDDFGDAIDPDRDNDKTSWLGPFRIGPLDFVALRYSMDCVNGQNEYQGFAMSHLDDLEGWDEWPICNAYRFVGEVPNDLDQYFVIKQGRIVAIRVHPDTRDDAHLAHQMRLTQLLNHCRPVITHVTPTKAETLEQVLLKRVEAEIGIPVVMTSHGPEVKQAEVVPGYEYLFT